MFESATSSLHNKAEIASYRQIAVTDNGGKLLEFVLHEVFYPQVKYICVRLNRDLCLTVP